MNDIAVFLGSGASFFCGCSTLHSFRRLMFDAELRKQEGLPALYDTTLPLLTDIDHELEIRSRPMSHDNYMWLLGEFRQFCGCFENAIKIQRELGEKWGELGRLKTAVDHAIGDMTRTTLFHYSINRVQSAKRESLTDLSRISEVMDFYRSLAMMNDSTCPCLQLFTTNYDVLFEDAFTLQDTKPEGFHLFNGIPGGVTEGAPWSQAEYVSKCGPALQLHRLHGCVCWYYHDFGDPKVYFHRNHSELQDWEAKACVMLPGREIMRGKDPHAWGYRRMHQVLVSCRILIVIGFSFWDDDVNQILLSANANRRVESGLRLVVVDNLLNTHTVLNRLAKAALNSVFPVRMPSETDIQCLEMNFGDEDFKNKRDQIISAITKGD